VLLRQTDSHRRFVQDEPDGWQTLIVDGIWALKIATYGHRKLRSEGNAVEQSLPRRTTNPTKKSPETQKSALVRHLGRFDLGQAQPCKRRHFASNKKKRMLLLSLVSKHQCGSLRTPRRNRAKEKKPSAPRSGGFLFPFYFEAALGHPPFIESGYVMLEENKKALKGATIITNMIRGRD
jgi:hypothetical protein